MIPLPLITGAARVLGDLENRVLRQAVQRNLVSFPSQVPVFQRQSRADLQHKVVVLYFVRGLTMDNIARRYGLGRQRMGQILTAWPSRAVKEGYLEVIDSDRAMFYHSASSGFNGQLRPERVMGSERESRMSSTQSENVLHG